MKHISFILALMIFVMSIVPCSDVVASSHDHTEAETHDHSHQDEEDDCTPFCGCQCCNITIAYPITDVLETIFVKHLFSYSFYYGFNYKHDHNTQVWHPPIRS